MGVALIRSLAAKLRIEGIIWGSPYIELVETSAIQSSTGFTVQVSLRTRRRPGPYSDATLRFCNGALC